MFHDIFRSKILKRFDITSEKEKRCQRNQVVDYDFLVLIGDCAGEEKKTALDSKMTDATFPSMESTTANVISLNISLADSPNATGQIQFYQVSKKLLKLLVLGIYNQTC